MRSIAGLLILWGLFLLGAAAYDEHRGIATLRDLRNLTNPRIAKRAEDPQKFRNLMTYQWFRGGAIFLGGVIIVRIGRRLDRLDPSSKHFAGNRAFDELDRVLDEEQERRRRPLR
jgi:hypothetical protein